MTKDMIFTKKGGMKIAGRMYLPEERADEANAPKWPLVIFAHGFGGCFQDLMHHGEGFADAGICCLFFDFCGGGPHSLSDGTMADMTVSTECEDLETVIIAVKKLDYIDPDKIFLQGESMGGLVCGLTGAKYSEEIAAMILWYPAFVIPDDARKRMQTGCHQVFGLSMSEAFDREAAQLPVYQILPKYRKPVLILHGDQDPVVPIRYSEEALKVLPDAELIVMPGAGHGYDGKASADARERSIAFVKGNL